MYFKNENDIKEFLNYFRVIGIGSRGICYYDVRNNQVLKIFHQFYDYNSDYNIKYKKEEILQFSNIVNDTFVWPIDVIYVKDEIVGYITKYIKADSLYEVNPLTVKLDHFIDSVVTVKKDIEVISNNKILMQDVLYNTLYGVDGIKIIDHDDYNYSDLEIDKVYNMNMDSFDLGILWFLVDDYFDDFVNGNINLKEMYADGRGNSLNFIKYFRHCLSEQLGREVVFLSDALSLTNKRKKVKPKYLRKMFNI